MRQKSKQLKALHAPFVVAVVLSSVLMTGCGDVSSGSDPISALGTNTSGAATPGEILDDAPSTQGNFGDVITLANTGLQLGFQGLSVDSVDTDFIELNWTAMQQCLNVVAAPPLIIISSEYIEPLTNADDVLFHLDGKIVATSTVYATGATIQISAYDLDGSLGRIGFNLRSVIGRYLWTSASLPERDYPHTCASGL